ncbi:glycosyltransferase family 87 protein [Granulicella sp. S190]|uniref:glycosyltransferase family 87 protein n=1 Tax=Granulicella sp. S190 TaxID=1747226 RepID=UPI00131D1176|nr:glycosyltransferase family 87 protein [Granulicella sp. S190]
MTSRAVRISSVNSHGKRLLFFVVCSLLLANVVQWGLCRALHLGNPGAIKVELADLLHVRQWTDSWLPMMKSLDYFEANPTKPIYAAPLYDTLIYSLASELPLVALRRLGVGDAAMLRLLALVSWLAVAGVAVVSLAMGRRLLRRRGVELDWATILAVVLACVGCYPLIKGYALGNAQTLLSFGFTLMLFLWTAGREREAAVVAAMLAFVKPQYVLLLVWMAVRRRWGAMWAFLICSAVLLGMSVAVFGWRNNLDYVGVLASLSHKAQSHYANQSMFGTLNRMIFNGENLGYTPHVYTPYVAWVYRTTLLTSLVLVAGVLLFPWGKMRSSTADLAAMGLASVAASPMAWEHHYGIVFGIFAWFWFSYGCWEVKRPWLWGLSFFLCDNFLSATNLLADKRGLNVLQSYMYLGALLLLVLLMRLARKVEADRTAVLA